MGVTDVDDKIIKRAKEQGVPFRSLAREQEKQFFEDLQKLYVKPPTAVTRVSEHLSEIVQYIEEIQRQGFAYEASDGSGVYFNTQQFGDGYGKLDPRKQVKLGVSDDEKEMQAAAVAAVEVAEPEEEEEKVKKDPRDFALWKTAKEPDEPAWPSPWGMGRPGWHIECSAMTHHVLGDKLDVHTGGVDLRFPHHNNEIAQSDGHTADHFRLFCLQMKYRANVIYSEDRVRDAEAVTDRLRGFFRNVMVYTGEHDNTEVMKSKRCEQQDLELLDVLFDTRAQVDAALLDDLDTPRALALVLDLISHGNMYLLARRSATEAPEEVLISLTNYVLEVLDLFGLEGLYSEFSTMMRRRFASPDQVQELQEWEKAGGHVSLEEQEALIQSLVKFRAAIREEALRDPKQPGNARVLELCDALRNVELPPLGVQIEDLAPGRSVFKRLSAAEQEAASREGAGARVEDVAEDGTQAALAQKQRKFEALMKVAPSALFREAPEFAGRFDIFDADGFPTHENGEPLTKSQRKKLAKKLTKHEKSYTKYWQGKRDKNQ
ncbi:Cysteine--tRNA ligase, mitochondrial [Phytophthora boehmeriae]|uniref:Cysteine--tRNA ligase, mitochondrial n=1 Tax=Phytophthora boehmeriae TaxID=109152 RepID=A0A8T1X2U9_9STRA|nr:Cysteine--tRNA ligase, mitochondrial [Phytophthora boehmeriae]